MDKGPNNVLHLLAQRTDTPNFPQPLNSLSP